MKLVIIATFIFLSSCSSSLDSVSRRPSSAHYPEFNLTRKLIVHKENCHQNNGPYISNLDYSFDEYKKETGIDYYASNKVIQNRYQELQLSKKRLPKRLYLQDGTFKLPHNQVELTMSEMFLNTLAHHVEQAFQMNVVDYLFYPDMGHAHLFMPKKKAGLYRESDHTKSVLLDPQLRAIYHTAEQLMMKDGPSPRDQLDYRQHRYRTRNLVGSFDKVGALEIHYAHTNKRFNTLLSLSGDSTYEKIGYTLYLSASPKGCIGYRIKNKLHYFDISFTSYR